MVRSFLTRIVMTLALWLLCVQADATEPSRILYLIQSGNLCSALELYDQHQQELGEHNPELLEQMGLILLDQGFRSSDPEIQLLTLFGSGISLNDRAQYILEAGVKSNIPQFQLVALNFLAKFQNDDAATAINRAMSSDALGVRLEAASLLAEMKDPKASGQIESLMQKVVPELLPIFPPLLAMAGDADSIRTLQKLMTHPLESVRIEAILAAARQGRDDLLPEIRRLATHLPPPQQEASAVALGMLKDGNSLPRLRELATSKVMAVRLAALQALYALGQEEVRPDVEAIAREGNLFAINILGEMPGSEPLLSELVKSLNTQIRLNAALALLQLRDSRCLAALGEVLVTDFRGIAFVKQQTYGKGLTAWKAVPSAKQNLANDPIAFELSLHLREGVLEKTLELSEDDFLSVAHTLFELRQNDLVPLLSRLLENRQTPKAVQLLKFHREQVGAPLVRNYCNLVLYRLKEPGPYPAAMYAWMTSKECHDLIQFRPMIPLEMRTSNPSHYLLTPEETSRLLVESFESLLQTQDDRALDILLHAIRHGNPKNRYALAGLLIRATN